MNSLFMVQHIGIVIFKIYLGKDLLEVITIEINHETLNRILRCIHQIWNVGEVRYES